MAKKPIHTARKSRFEMLEDRRLLTTYNLDAKFVDNGSAAGGEAAFGDNATIAQFSSDPGSPSGYYNNNASSLTPTATDSATSTSPWTFGALDSGPVNYANSVPYSFDTYVDPNSFDNYLTGSASALVARNSRYGQRWSGRGLSRPGRVCRRPDKFGVL